MPQISAGNVFNLAFSVFMQYEDQLISPKQFVHMSGKATLKDWKRAIRMGGVMLRYALLRHSELSFHDCFYEIGTYACEMSNFFHFFTSC